MGTTCRYCGDSVEARSHCSSCHRPLDADPQSLVSQTLGGHRLDRLVGEGPSGMVFEAVHLSSGQHARLKLIDSELASDTEIIEGIGQLVVGSTGLQDSLPELIEVSLEDPSARIVSVLWRDGETLRERLGRGPLAETEACVVVGGVLKALDALHGSGLSHRDIKPENVLLAPQGEKPSIHLLDVGPSLLSAKTRTGAHYRSPEQARGGEGVGPATDIYGCGVLLYESLTGRQPFEANDYDVLMSQISLRQPPPITEYRPDLDPELVEVVGRAMHTVAGERYRAPVDMLRGLRTYVAAQQRPSAPEARMSLPQEEIPQLAAVPVESGHGVPAAPPAPANMLAAPGLPKPPAPATVPPLSAPEPAFHFEDANEVASLAQPSLGDLEPPSSESRSGGAKIAAILFLIIMVVVGGGLMYYTFWAEQERENLTTQLDQQRPPDAGSKAIKRTKSRGTVRVKLVGVPQGASWFVDGRRLGANPFRAPRNPAVRTIRVEAPNYDTFETEVSFGEDVEIAVEMTPIEGTAPPATGFKAHTRGRGANQRPAKRKRGGSKSPPDRFAADQAPTKLRGR